MIRLDRSLPVSEQLADQLRYEIAGGRFRAGDKMPSTRELARLLEVSFHTVRKVYQALEREGLLRARPGAGYIIEERAPLRKEDRMERGAAIAQDALKRMLGLGLSDDDISYLFDEQRAMLDSGRAQPKVVVAVPYLEMAERCAEQISTALRLDAEPCVLSNLERHTNADYVVVAFRDVRQSMLVVPGADVIGVFTSLPAEVLDAVSRLGADSSLAIIVRDDDAAPPLMQELRSATAFGGPMVSSSITERHDDLMSRIGEADIVVGTPSCARRLRGRLPVGRKLYIADQLITEASIDRIRTTLPP